MSLSSRSESTRGFALVSPQGTSRENKAAISRVCSSVSTQVAVQVIGQVSYIHLPAYTHMKPKGQHEQRPLVKVASSNKRAEMKLDWPYMAGVRLSRQAHRFLRACPLAFDNRLVFEWQFLVEAHIEFKLHTSLDLDSEDVAIAGG